MLFYYPFMVVNTVLGMFIRAEGKPQAALIPGIIFFLKTVQTYRFGGFSFDGEVLRSTMLNGNSEFVGEMASCISMFCYNHVILRIAGAAGVLRTYDCRLYDLFIQHGYNVIASMYFTSCGKAFPLALSSVMRGIVFLLICIFVLPAVLSMRGIWLAAPVTGILSAALTVILLKRYHVRFKNLNDIQQGG